MTEGGCILSPSAETVLSQFTLKKNQFPVQFLQMKMNWFRFTVHVLLGGFR